MRRAREKADFSIWLCILVCYPLTRLLARRRFEGLEHIPDSGPVLVVCNHISYLDPLYTAVFVRHRGRIPHFLAKAGLWRIQAVLIYPEGTVTRDPQYWPMVARTGVARLALCSGVPVVPVAHWGTQRVYDRYRGRFRPVSRADVVVRAGAPVDLDEFRQRPVDRQVLHEVTEGVMGAVRDLLAEVRQEQGPAGFFAPAGPGQDRDQEL